MSRDSVVLTNERSQHSVIPLTERGPMGLSERDQWRQTYRRNAKLVHSYRQAEHQPSSGGVHLSDSVAGDRPSPEWRWRDWTWIWKCLWRPKQENWTILRIAETVLFHHGHWYRWMFTSKDGTVLKKNTQNHTVDHLLARWNKIQGSVGTSKPLAVLRFPQGVTTGTRFLQQREVERFVTHDYTIPVEQCISLQVFIPSKFSSNASAGHGSMYRHEYQTREGGTTKNTIYVVPSGEVNLGGKMKEKDLENPFSHLIHSKNVKVNKEIERMTQTLIHAAKVNGKAWVRRIVADYILDDDDNVFFVGTQECMTSDLPKSLRSPRRASPTKTEKKEHKSIFEIRGLIPPTKDEAVKLDVHASAAKGDVQMLKYAIQKGENVTHGGGQYGDTPLHLASALDHTEAVQVLLDAGASPNAINDDHATPLHMAAISGSAGCIELLARAGGDVNRPDGDGQPPLHMAAGCGHTDAVSKLLEYGAKMSKKGRRGDTPLHVAVSEGQQDMIKTLAEASQSAFIDLRNDYGATPLHLGSMVDGVGDIVEQLVEYGASVNIVDRQGMTPLHVAAAKGHQKVASVLLQARSNVHAVDQSHCTPLHHAAANNHAEMCALLERWGGMKSCGDPQAEELTNVMFEAGLFVRTEEGSRVIKEIERRQSIRLLDEAAENGNNAQKAEGGPEEEDGEGDHHEPQQPSTPRSSTAPATGRERRESKNSSGEAEPEPRRTVSHQSSRAGSMRNVSGETKSTPRKDGSSPKLPRLMERKETSREVKTAQPSKRQPSFQRRSTAPKSPVKEAAPAVPEVQYKWDSEEDEDIVKDLSKGKDTRFLVFRPVKRNQKAEEEAVDKNTTPVDEPTVDSSKETTTPKAQDDHTNAADGGGRNSSSASSYSSAGQTFDDDDAAEAKSGEGGDKTTEEAGVNEEAPNEPNSAPSFQEEKTPAQTGAGDEKSAGGETEVKVAKPEVGAEAQENAKSQPERKSEIGEEGGQRANGEDRSQSASMTPRTRVRTVQRSKGTPRGLNRTNTTGTRAADIKRRGTTGMSPAKPPATPRRAKTTVFVRGKLGNVEEASEKPLYKFMKSETRIVRETLELNGMSRTEGDSWSVMWCGTGVTPTTFSGMKPWQKVNHFPRSSEMTRKDKLYFNLARMQQQHGAEYFNFVPTSFVLPKDYEMFKKEVQTSQSGTSWIVKPSASSRGRGISVIKNINQLPAINPSESLLVSRYVDNPLLINGHKFDLRLYVIVTSYDPLRVYMYRDGLARFASEKYRPVQGSADDKFVHLTNYSINKNSDSFIRNSDTNKDDVGHKWSVRALKRHLKEVMNVDVDILWSGIHDIVIKSLLSIESSVNSAMAMHVPGRSNCFEILGFDILVDDTLRPWLVEVNLSPSLSCDSPLDAKIKTRLLSDTFNVVGIPANPPAAPKKPTASKAKSFKLPRLSTSGYGQTTPVTPKKSEWVGAVSVVEPNELSLDDSTKILKETNDEMKRAKRMDRIYPCLGGHYYDQFFEKVRPTNTYLQTKLFRGTRYRGHDPCRQTKHKMRVSADASGHAKPPETPGRTAKPTGHYYWPVFEESKVEIPPAEKQRSPSPTREPTSPTPPKTEKVESEPAQSEETKQEE